MKRTPLLIGIVLLITVGIGWTWRLRSHTFASKPPSHPYRELGETAWKEGRITDAVIQFNRAIAVEPRDESAYIRLAQLYKAQDRSDLAFLSLEMLRASNPNAPHLCLQLAEIGLDVEDKEMARECAQKALLQDPKNPQAHLIYGLAMVNLHHVEEGLSALLDAQKLAPNDIEIGQALLEMYQLQKNYPKSIQIGEAMLQTAPRSARLHFRLGWAYARLETPASRANAEQHLKTAMEVMPDWYEPYAEMGRIALEQRQSDVAQGYFEKAWERDPTVLEVGERLAPLWKSKGDPRYETLSARLAQLRQERQSYATNRLAETKQTLSKEKLLELAQSEAKEGKYAVALYRLKRLLVNDSTYLPALRLYRVMDKQARNGYPEYLLPGPHITLEPGI